MSTSLDAELLPYSPNLRLKVIPTDFLAKPFEWAVLSDRHIIELRYTTDETIDLNASQERIAELVIAITAQLAVPADDTHLKELIRDEQAMGRALMLTRTALTIGNVLGDRLKLRLSEWEANDAEEFPLLRSEPWIPEPSSDSAQVPKRPLTMGSGDVPAELLHTERIKHSDRRVVSRINLPLWDKAGWKGAGFFVYPDPGVAPILALVFKDKEAGASIFVEWRQDFGPRDESGSLRITIITGIDRRNPAHYRMIIGSNDGWKPLTLGSHVLMISRVLTVTPTSTENLDRFLEKYRETGYYVLAPGHVQSDRTLPGADFGLTIFSSKINVRPAWEIREHDPDVVGIHDDDDVVIPEGIAEPPILKTLEIIRRRRAQGGLRKPTGEAKTHGKLGRDDPCHCGSGKKFKKCHGR